MDSEIRCAIRSEDRDELEQLARENERSLSGEVRRAIRLYLASTRKTADVQRRPVATREVGP